MSHDADRLEHSPPSPGLIARRPVGFAVACGLGYGAFAAVYVFVGRVGAGDLTWIAVLAACGAVAGASVAYGRRTASHWMVALGLAIVALPPAARELPWFADLLGNTGLAADRGSNWRWVETGDTMASVAVTPGVLASIILATAAAGAVWVAHRRPIRRVARVHPLLPATLAGAMPVGLAVGPGYDPALTPFLAMYAAVVGMGAAAATIGAHRRDRFLIIWGSVTAAALPLAHGLGLVTPLSEQWAPTLLHDLVGVLLTLVAALLTGIGLLRTWRSDMRLRSRHRLARGE